MEVFKKIYHKFISEDRKLKNYPILSILFFFPASYITGILIIPFVILVYPIIFCFKKHEIKIMRFSLYLQNSIGLSIWLVIEEWIASKFLHIFSINISIGWIDFLIAILIAFIVFYNHIKRMVHDTLVKTYGSDWKDLAIKGSITSSLVRYVVDNPLNLNRPGFEEGEIKDGKREGLWIRYDDLGSKEFAVLYKNDKKEGLQKCYHYNGQLESEQIFKDGELISKKCWDEQGNEIE